MTTDTPAAAAETTTAAPAAAPAPAAPTGPQTFVWGVGRRKSAVARVRVAAGTGKKADVLEYDTYSRYPGGRHVYSFKRMNEEHPEKLIELAVRRMLPKNKMGRNILGKLKIYKGTDHPHQAQQPKELKIA